MKIAKNFSISNWLRSIEGTDKVKALIVCWIVIPLLIPMLCIPAAFMSNTVFIYVFPHV